MDKVCGTIVVAIWIWGCGGDVTTTTPGEGSFDGESGGCGHFDVHRFSVSKTLAVRVVVNESRFEFGEEPTTIELDTRDDDTIRVEILEFSAPAESFFCDDVAGDDPNVVAEWRAVSGQVIVVLQGGTPPPHLANATHRVSVELQNVTLQNKRSTATCRLSSALISNVWVGWAEG